MQLVREATPSQQCLSHRRSVACQIGRRDVSFMGLISLLGQGATHAGPAAASQQLLQQLSHTQTQQAAAVRAAVSAAAGPAAAASAASAASKTSCNAPLDPSLAAAFTQAVYDTVVHQQIVPEQQLQLERYKLQTQEYKYYAAANQARMPQLPYLEDNSGGLSNRTYYNFVSYVLWKVVARHLPTPDQRTAFCADVGGLLLERLAPDTLATVKAAAAAAAGPRQVPAGVLVPALQQLLDLLQARGYTCGWQLVWGSQPGGWPADWAASQQQLLLGEEELQQEGPLPPGSLFQVKLQQPADIEGSVALRAEEDGFWSRHISSIVVALLAAGGYSSPAVDEYFYQDYWQGPSRAVDKLLLLLGDPLQQVDVPWTPNTLVQNWTL